MLMPCFRVSIFLHPVSVKLLELSPELEAHARQNVSIAFGFVLAINHHDRQQYPTWVSEWSGTRLFFAEQFFAASHA